MKSGRSRKWKKWDELDRRMKLARERYAKDAVKIAREVLGENFADDPTTRLAAIYSLDQTYITLQKAWWKLEMESQGLHKCDN